MILRLKTRCELDRCVVDHPGADVTFDLPVTREDLRTIILTEVRNFVALTGRDRPHAVLVIGRQESLAFTGIEASIILHMDTSATSYLSVDRIVAGE